MKPKAYTDLKQSEILVKILPPESADGWYQRKSENEYNSTPNLEGMIFEDDIPCWSLAALLSVLPKEIEIDGQRYAPCLFPVQDEWLLKLWYNSNHTITSPMAIFSDNLIDACYEMIIKLKEQKLL